jgi:acyl-coenzyme A synthetase/AMP-(fatty) acid ligase
VIAFVALRDGLTVGEEQLQDLVRSRVADYKTPERIAFLPVLPKGPTGKVERRALKDLALSSPEMGLAAFRASVKASVPTGYSGRSGCR